jgi:hypothetical protein
VIFIYSIVKITGTNFGCWMNSAIPVVFVSPSWLGPQFTDPILIQNFVRGIFHVWENGDEDQNNNYCSAILKKTWNSWSTGFWWLQWRWFNCKNTDLYIYILIDWLICQPTMGDFNGQPFFCFGFDFVGTDLWKTWQIP